MSVFSVYLYVSTVFVNSFPTSGDFCGLVITFANSLDPDQTRSGSKLFDTDRGIP